VRCVLNDGGLETDRDGPLKQIRARKRKNKCEGVGLCLGRRRREGGSFRKQGRGVAGGHHL